ncbi:MULTISPECIES: hypothetical protein [unclassified Bradyrhizobium]
MQRIRERDAERRRTFGYRDISKGRARHKGFLLGGAAKAVVRGSLENDGD